MGQYTIQNGPWADESLVQQLRDLWDEGLSCSQIARALGRGITRNSVIGKATRLGLPARGQGSMSRKSYQRTAPRKPVVVAPPAPPPEEPEFLCPPETVADGPVCQFIRGDIGTAGWTMCGQPGRPWCAYHRTIVFDAIRTAEANKKAEARKKSGGDKFWEAA